jgi:ABC-type lipoprotein release transport system permease subunit
MTHTFADYGLYFENNEYANDLLSYGNEHGFYLKTIDFESGLTINKMTSTFNTLFVIILICIYVVFGAYIIIYGVNTVKSNKEEIGIYKALGGKFGNISKVLFIDVLLTGIIISVLSVFFTPFIINLADDIIVNSFKDVLNLCAVNIEIIKIYPGILALNYSLLNMLILVSAIVPTILLIRLKPIEIIKN